MSMIKRNVNEKKEVCISEHGTTEEGRELLKQAMVEPIKIDIDMKNIIGEENIEILKNIMKSAPTQRARSSLMQRDCIQEDKEHIIEECPEIECDSETEGTSKMFCGEKIVEEPMEQEECCVESVCDVETPECEDVCSDGSEIIYEDEIVCEDICCDEEYEEGCAEEDPIGISDVGIEGPQGAVGQTGAPGVTGTQGANKAVDGPTGDAGPSCCSGTNQLIEEKAVFEALTVAIKQQVEPEPAPDEPQECCEEAPEELVDGDAYFKETLNKSLKQKPSAEDLSAILVENMKNKIAEDRANKEEKVATTAPGFYSTGSAGQIAKPWTKEALEEKAKSLALKEAFEKHAEISKEQYMQKLAEKLAEAKDVDVPKFYSACNSTPSAWQEPDKELLEKVVAETMSDEEIAKKVEELVQNNCQWVGGERHILPIKIQKIDQNLNRTISSDLYNIPERKKVSDEKVDIRNLEVSLVKEENLLDSNCKIDIIKQYIYRLTIYKSPTILSSSLCRHIDDIYNDKNAKQVFKEIIIDFPENYERITKEKNYQGPKLQIIRLADDKYKEFIFEEPMYIYYEKDIKKFIDFMKKHDVPYELIDRFLDIYYETRISYCFNDLIKWFEERKEFNLIDGPEDDVSYYETK